MVSEVKYEEDGSMDSRLEIKEECLDQKQKERAIKALSLIHR